MSSSRWLRPHANCAAVCHSLKAFKRPNLPEFRRRGQELLFLVVLPRLRLLPETISWSVVSTAAGHAHPACCICPISVLRDFWLCACRLCYQGRTHVPWLRVCVIGRSFPRTASAAVSSLATAYSPNAKDFRYLHDPFGFSPKAEPFAYYQLHVRNESRVQWVQS